MGYRTKAQRVDAYQFTRDPGMDSKVPQWLKEKVDSKQIIYDSTGILWVYPHRSIVSLQQAHLGDYLVYNSVTDEVWVEWKDDFEAKYERY